MLDNVPACQPKWCHAAYSQLHRSSAAKAAMQQYRSLLKQGVTGEVLAEIDKDTHRTFPGHPRLSTDEGQAAMRCVLAAYAACDPAIGCAYSAVVHDCCCCCRSCCYCCWCLKAVARPPLLAATHCSYTQGMNFLAGLLLTYIDGEAEVCSFF